MDELRLMNAAGTCKTVEDVGRFAGAPIAELTLGSVTALPRAGNQGATFWIDDRTGASLNALGLPNPGLEYYRSHLPRIARTVHEAGKALRVSLAGFSVEDYRILAEGLAPFAIDTIEINLSCPNVWDGADQKPVFALDPVLVAGICRIVAGATPRRIALAVKLAPSDPHLLKRLAATVAGLPRLDEIVAVNTIPNAFVFDDAGRPAIGGNGLAGLGGRALKPVALGHVRQLRALLPDRIAVTGVGGIFEGRDVTDYTGAGAAAVQVGTACYAYGAGVFQDIVAEFLDLAA